ncbi:MAG: TIGR01777 family oxidoreductase [Lentisphaeraceae bacterium]|nr:TIGR01777 family oxidoreductase [Lentisphaeraceae bacterium]
MGKQQLVRTKEMPVSAEILAAWHESPGAFGRIQPPWESAEIINKATEIADGLEEHIQIKIGPLKKMWIARYHDVIKNEQFCDLQVSGPFAYWDHKHVFKAIDSDKSELVDDISYKEPMGPVGRLLAGKMIASKLDAMFNYRHAVTHADLARHFNRKIKPMKVAITGGTGLVGGCLGPLLQTMGHEVFILTRNPKKENHIKWDPATSEIDHEKLEGIDAFINLAGRSIAAPWTSKVKKDIISSRLDSSELLVKAIKVMKRKPSVVITASGSAYYPLYTGETYSEDGPKGEGFLPELAEKWEGVFKPLDAIGVRVVKLRIGVVLTPAGGALQKMLPAFKLGLGGPFSSGKQYMSWIAIDDLIDIMAFALEDEKYSGVINAVSPEPVTNKEFSKTLGKVLNRPTVLPVPAAILKMIPGGMGKELFLASNRLEPAKLKELGYEFRHPDLLGTFKHLFGQK